MFTVKRAGTVGVAIAAAVVGLAVIALADPAGWGVPSIISKIVTFREPAAGQVIVDCDTTTNTTTNGCLRVVHKSGTASAAGIYATANQTADVDGQGVVYAEHSAVTAMTGSNNRFTFVGQPRGHASDGASTGTIVFVALAPSVASGGVETASLILTGYTYTGIWQSGDTLYQDYLPTIQTQNTVAGVGRGLNFVASDGGSTNNAGGTYDFNCGDGIGNGAGGGFDIDLGIPGASGQPGRLYIRTTTSGTSPRIAPASPGSPTLSAGCGTGPTISGNDIAGIVTLGTSQSGSCVLTFEDAYTSTPACTQAINSTTVVPNMSISATAITWTFSADASSLVLNYICMETS